MTPAEYGVSAIQSWAQEKLSADDAKGLMGSVAAVIRQAVREERERCAKVCEEFGELNRPDQLAFDIARRIRSGE